MIEKETQQNDFEEILYKFKDMVYHLSLSLTKNETDAEDIFQEVFLRLVRKNPKFESEEHIKAWLIRTTINCSNTLWSSPWRKRIISLNWCDEITQENNETDNYVLEIVNSLPKKYQIVIHLYYYEDMTIQTISDMLGIRYNAIAKRLSRARAILKNEIEGDYNYA